MNEATRKELEALRAEKSRLAEENRVLRREYRKLHDAAEDVTAASLKPGICKPTVRGESGDARMIVATRALDRLTDVLLGMESDEKNA